MLEKTSQNRPNRIRETLDKLYEQHPPQFREQLRRLQQDPSSRVFAPLAESYRRLGRLEEAIEICQKGLEHHPDFHGGRVALAKCFIDKQRYEDAQRELERVVHLAPENLLAQKLLGESLLAQDMPRQALHAFKMALLLAPCDISLTDRVHQLEKQLVDSPESSLSPASAGIPTEEIVDQALPAFPFEEEPVENEPSEEISILQSTEAPEDTSWKTGELKISALESEPPDFPIEEIVEDESSAEVDAILGFTEESEDVFSVGSVASAFLEPLESQQQEITTETLGDLYFTQGQYGQSLKIFEKLYRAKPSDELEKKMKACRVKLGVDPESQLRNKKIEVLKGILNRLHQQSDPSE